MTEIVFMFVGFQLSARLVMSDRPPVTGSAAQSADGDQSHVPAGVTNNQTATLNI